MQRPKHIAASLTAAAALALGGCALLAPPADTAEKQSPAVGAQAKGERPDGEPPDAADAPGPDAAAAPAEAGVADGNPAAKEEAGSKPAATEAAAASKDNTGDSPSEPHEAKAAAEGSDAKDDDAGSKPAATDAVAASKDNTGDSPSEPQDAKEAAEGSDAKDEGAEPKLAETEPAAASKENADDGPSDPSDAKEAADDSAGKEEDAGPKLELTLNWVSDYVFRGVSLSNNLPAIQGSLDYSFPLLWGLSGSVGLWRSQVRFDTDEEFPPGEAPDPVPTVGVRRESGIYGGVSGDLAAGWTWSVQAYSYSYPGFKRLDYVEKSLTLARSFAQFPGQPQLEVSRATFRSVFFPGAEGKYFETNLKLALIKEFTLAAHFGSSRFADQSVGGRDYVDRALTLSRPLGPYLFDLVATSTNTEQFGRLAHSKLFLRVSRTF